MEVADRGHEIAVHCFRHVEHDSLSEREARDDLARAVEAVAAATGAEPLRCRPPYGRFSFDSHAACLDLGLEPVYWSAWGLDWETVGADRIAELVTRDLSAGAIALLHDSPRYAPRPSAVPTAAALPAIGGRARELGLALERLGRPAAT
jgi:peptidoglycan/xylan/chitin deacetylase (PgdA/CDA1 family)